MTRMPVVFIGHGSPMNTLESNRYTQAWREIGAAVPRPRALLVVSAHWYIGATAVTAMAKPRTIHDFYGFPPELFAFQYPAPGAPDVAAEVAETVKPRWVGLDKEQWGLDHGTWSVLAHMYPAADIPVVQLSINGLKPLEDHLDLAARLAPLRDRGVLIVASGNVVHNLRLIDRTRGNEGFDWARRFDDAVYDQLASDPADILSVTGHRDYVLAVPTPDHFVPLLYLAGLATKEEPPQAVGRRVAAQRNTGRRHEHLKPIHLGVSGLLACGANTGRGWLVADGILAIVVGVIVLAGWPVNSLWIIGLLLAIDLTFYGATIVALAIALKRGDAADETALRTGHLPRAAAARA